MSKIVKVFAGHLNYKPNEKVNFDDTTFKSEEYTKNFNITGSKYSLDSDNMLVGRCNLLTNRIATSVVKKTAVMEELDEKDNVGSYEQLKIKLFKNDTEEDDKPYSSFWKITVDSKLINGKSKIPEETIEIFRKLKKEKINITHIFVEYTLTPVGKKNSKRKNFTRKAALKAGWNLSEIWITEEDAIKHGFEILDEHEIQEKI